MTILPIVMTFLIFNAFLFTQMTHPLSMGLILLIQTLLTCLITGTIAKNFWFSYILFLIFIGGMLILFIYMSSLASNEKFIFSTKTYILFVALPIIIFLMLSDNFFNLTPYYNKEIYSMNNFSLLMKENFFPLSKMYDSPNNFMVIFMIIYLLLNLVIIVKITNMFSGPLRTMN